MFKLTMMVDGSKLPKALTALDGLIYNLTVTPVRNAQVSKGQVKEEHVASGATNAVRSLVKAASEAGKLVITRNELAEQIKQFGYHPNNASVGIAQLMKQEVLVKQQRGIYQINVAHLTGAANG